MLKSYIKRFQGGEKGGKAIAYMALVLAFITPICLSGCMNYASSKNDITLTFYYADTRGAPFDNDNLIFERAREITGIGLECIAPEKARVGTQHFNVMMSNKENIADIVATKIVNFEKYAPEGYFVPLDDLIEKYAPNIHKYLNENEDLKKAVTASDGRIYYIPHFTDGTTAKGWFIRQDWLDKLGLNRPANIDEFYEVLKAFRDRDPNGNGIKDEIPFFDRHKLVNDLFPLFGIRNDWSVKDGEVVYSRYTPEYKGAISTIASWYAEGLIDKEIFTRGNNAREMLLDENLGGLTHDWFTTTSRYTDRLKDKIEGFMFVPFEPPADVNGEVWEDSIRPRIDDAGWGISINNEYPEETIKYFDFWFSEEGIRLHNFGIEGFHYNIENGEIVINEELLDKNSEVNASVWGMGMQIMIGSVQDFSFEKLLMNDIAGKGIDMYVKNGYIKEKLPTLQFTVEEQKTISAKWEVIMTLIFETEQKWVLGVETVEEGYDLFMEQMRNLGMDEITAIYNAAYKRNISGD